MTAFVELLQLYNSKVKEGCTTVPVQSLAKTFGIIENTSLYAAALETGFSALIGKLIRLIQSEEPITHDGLKEACSDILALKLRVLDTNYIETRAFCAAYESMARAKLLESSGVDPADAAAVLKFLCEKSKGQLSQQVAKKAGVWN